jgi:arsenite methyltransferase
MIPPVSNAMRPAAILTAPLAAENVASFRMLIRLQCCWTRWSRNSQKTESSMSQSIETIVRDNYGRTATSGLSSNDAGVRAVAEAFGYSAAELSSIPAEANMGLSCGNPIAMANLRAGEVVVDLGSGGGLDVFLAAQKVGPTGRAIGIDMTPQMVDLGRKNAAKSSLTNVEFHLSTIDKLPLPDASVNVVISNCVINLASNKSAVFREIARVLKPGGRVAISDIALKRTLPERIARDVSAYVGCISGAMLIDDYRRELTAAGLHDVVLIDAGADLNAYAQVDGQQACCSPVKQSEPTAPAANAAASCCGPTCCESEAIATLATLAVPTVHGGLSELLSQHNVNDFAASVKVFALKR